MQGDAEKALEEPTTVDGQEPTVEQPNLQGDV